MEFKIQIAKKVSKISGKNLPNSSCVMNNSFSTVHSNLRNSIEFFVKVLSFDSWPLDVIKINQTEKNSSGNIRINKNKFKNINENSGYIVSINLPQELTPYIHDFTNFYYDKFKSRHLIWAHDLSWAEITAKFSRSYSLLVSSYQMAILYLFNAKKCYKYAEILTLVNDNNSVSILEQHIIPLIKSGLLCHISLKNQNNEIKTYKSGPLIMPYPPIEINDEIRLNTLFNSKDYKINLNYKQNVDEKVNDGEITKEVSHLILEDRKYQIDAAIIKSLKLKKRISFEMLKLNIIESVSTYFIPETSLIKTRLDNLIERNFIERDSNDPNVYVYST
jgi:hypothetical protein